MTASRFTRFRRREQRAKAPRLIRDGAETRFADNVRERALDGLMREIYDDELTRRVALVRELLE